MTFGHSTSGYWKLAPFGDRRLLAKLEYIIANYTIYNSKTSATRLLGKSYFWLFDLFTKFTIHQIHLFTFTFSLSPFHFHLFTFTFSLSPFHLLSFPFHLFTFYLSTFSPFAISLPSFPFHLLPFPFHLFPSTFCHFPSIFSLPPSAISLPSFPFTFSPSAFPFHLFTSCRFLPLFHISAFLLFHLPPSPSQHPGQD